MASLGMSTATTEQAWRFDAKVANLLFATVEEAELVGCFELVALLLDSFLLGNSDIFLFQRHGTIFVSESKEASFFWNSEESGDIFIVGKSGREADLRIDQ